MLYIYIIILVIVVVCYFFYFHRRIDKIKEVIFEKNELENQFVFMDIERRNAYKKEALGRIVIELYSSIVPKTSYNFYELCRSKKYKGTIFHRVIPQFMIQSGDFNGSGGMSIFETKEFEDENFMLKHDKEGLLSMANRGPNTNTSQFFILTQATAPHLDGKHVVFGRVVDGYSFVKLIEIEPRDLQDKPIQDIVISDCGIYDHKKNEDIL